MPDTKWTLRLKVLLALLGLFLAAFMISIGVYILAGAGVRGAVMRTVSDIRPFELIILAVFFYGAASGRIVFKNEEYTRLNLTKRQ